MTAQCQSAKGPVKKTILHIKKIYEKNYVVKVDLLSPVSHLVLGLAFSLSDVSSDNPLSLFSQSGVRA